MDIKKAVKYKHSL